MTCRSRVDFHRMLYFVLAFLCFNGITAPAWAQFETRATIALPSVGLSAAAGDFNHDGKLDVLARSLAGGKREGVLSALGTFFGGMVHVLAAALGISVVLARSAIAFSTIKYAGAAYLCVLGIRMIRDARKPETIETCDLPAKINGSARNPLWQGIATEVLNPKTALFFLSFIPQFVNRATGHLFFQSVILGTVSVALNTSADVLVILLAGPKIRSSAVFRRRQRTATGAIMIGLGTYLATSESH